MRRNIRTDSQGARLLRGNKQIRVVLFGGTGFVGRHLANSLFNQGCEVVIVSRRPQRHRHLLVLPTVHMVEGDIHDCESISRLISNADAVVNLIGILNEGGGNHSFERIHSRFPENLAAACIEQKVGRLIHVSALGSKTDAPSSYLQSKGRGETAIVAAMDRGLSATVFRPSIVFGPHGGITQMFERMLRLARGFFLVVCPDAQMQPVHVQDVAQCIAKSLRVPQSAGNCYDLAGPDVLSLYEIVSIINELSGCDRRLVRVNDSASGLLASVMQFLPGKPITPDNVLSMQVPSVSDCGFPAFFGSPLRGMRQTAESWLIARESQFNAYRAQAGR